MKFSIFSLVLVILFTGCGGGSSSGNSQPVNATPAPPPPASTPVEISLLDAVANEADGQIIFTLQLSATSASTISVQFATTDGTAVAGTDYDAQSGTLSIRSGETSGTISIDLIDDSDAEPTENFTLTLNNAVNADFLNASAIGSIEDNDALVAVNVFNPDWGQVGVFTEAATCARCHRASSDNDASISAVMREPLDDTGVDISTSTQWRHTMMAHAFDDPYYRAKLADETSIFSDIAATLEDKCLTCHAPMGRTHAHQVVTTLDSGPDCLLADGCYRITDAELEMHAREGVSCTLCHQVRADQLGSPDSFSGQFSIAEAGDPESFTIYGPYQNPDPGGANAMQSQSGYTPTIGDHLSRSGHCASCHTLFTGTIDVTSGAPSGSMFLEQGPYLEWLNSNFVTGSNQAKECQDCHQPVPSGAASTTRIAVRPDGSVNAVWPERNPFSVHEFVGGNTHILQMLSDYQELLGLELSTTKDGFAEKIAQTRDFLEQASATIDITRTEQIGDTLNVDVFVVNQTGHKLPTSYPSRRVWLHFVVRDTAGAVVFESGAPDTRGRISTDSNSIQADCLAIEKPAGFSNSGCYEPHRDIITSESQIAIYEAVMADTNGHITHVLLHGDRYLKDNRLLPSGFTNTRGNTIEPQTLPVGTSSDTDFNRSGGAEGSGTDVVHYQVDTSEFTGPYVIDARLLYQSIRPSFTASMHTQTPLVERFKIMYDNTPPPVEVLADATATP